MARFDHLFPAAAAAWLLLVPGARASVISRLRSHRTSNISLQKRLHVNTLITDPGTFEVDWAGVYSITSSNFNMPTTLKFTPAGRHILWGRTEYSVALDSLDVVDQGGGHVTQFSESVTFSGTAVLHDGQKLDIALEPQATVFFRGENGGRFGAVAIARYDTGRNSMGVTAGWSAATASSANNPAVTWDFGTGYGRQLPGCGLLSHFTPHANLVWEKSVGTPKIVSVFEGVEYQITDRFAFDLSGQQFGAFAGPPDHQVVVAVTWNFGKVH